MGFSHSWIAVQGLTPARALEALGMEVKAVIEPDYFPEGIAIGQMPGGWLIVLTDRRASAFEGDLVALAAFGPAVACEIREVVMNSEARGYEGASEKWRVGYDCEKGRYALEIAGDPPSQLETIRAEAQAQQEAEGGEDAGVDYMFDIPALLAKSICGYMLGEVEPDGFRYSELQPIGGWPVPVRKPGFFARLFGRG
ncbi:MAG TPA: hypothetical protein VK533_11765 [Sphingomonas sp.]|uniref:hypothetical protein n=1 Tax=Sphingomonas sp. TaxID=28214 RepID=UPI002BDBAE08|nr:hypothetical protein [Sphingomonas sp.]HMI20214.1 hypothetical protein [Sphingomonas sp.]